MASWYVYSGAGGAGTGANWANAYTTLAAACAGGAGAGDTFYVAHDHAETQASAITISVPSSSPVIPCIILCVNRSGSVPPVSADLRTTATITTTGNNSLTLQSGAAYIYGITFNAGTGAVGATFVCSLTWSHFKNCQCRKLGTSGTGNAINLSGSLVFDNTSVEVGATSDAVRAQNCRLIWKNCATPLTGATIPTSLIGNSTNSGNVLLEALDLSALGSGKNIVGALFGACDVHIKDCKLNASVTIAATQSGLGTGQIYVSRTDSSGTNYIERKYNHCGSQIDETVIVRTGGASDGTTPKSRNITTTDKAKWHYPFDATPISIWQDSTSAASATIEGVWNAAALPNNDDIWFDLEYLGASGNPQGSFVIGTKADFLAAGSALTASTQAWDSLVTARANSTTYAVGDVRKVASNPGRIFFVTAQTGASASSEPAGFASAVDGGSVTDGNVTWRAGVRFKQTLNFTSALKGPVYAYPRAGKLSTTFYLDPLITLA